MAKARPQKGARSSESGKVRSRPPKTSGKRATWLVRSAVVFGAVALVLLIAAGGLLAAGATGLGKGRIEAVAQRALSQFAGESVRTRFGTAHLVPSGFNLIALELQDVELATSDERNVTAGRLQFGLALWPLLQGRIELADARLAKMRITPSGESSEELMRLVGPLRNERGLIEPDRLAHAILAGSEWLYSLFAGRPGMEVEMLELVFDPIPDEHGDEILLSKAQIAKAEGEIGIELSGTARAVPFSASARIGKTHGEGTTHFTVNADVPHLLVDFGTRADGKDAGHFVAGIGLELDGQRAASGHAIVQLRLDLNNAVLSLPDGELDEGNWQLFATLEEGSGKVELDRLTALIGRNEIHFHGALGPAPAEAHPDPVYRYELVSDGSRLAPSDSPEPSLALFARIAGIVNPEEGRVTADELGVRTTHGTIWGNGALVFAEEGSPAMFLAISGTDIPVSHAKQLWPWFAAHGARRWALPNVFGGTVRTAQITLSTPPGRIGDGIPLGPDEISGHFTIDDTRFNLAGELPPVRDAKGHVEFKGRAVRIGIASGSAFMESGRRVDGANGTLAINVIRGKPLIGALELDVSGDADAITELASYEPIDAMRFVELAPEDFSGKVTGHVSGLIPLQREVDRSLIDWRVALDYDALDISRPFNGQVLTGAAGSIQVDRQQAIIEARGYLNGMPAELALVEPLNREARGKRDIRVELDDEIRAKMLPGLNTLLAGPVSVSLVQRPGGEQEVGADLTRAVLRLPWIGWRKGAGVPAKMTFVMHQNGKETRLDGLQLSGDGFAAEGSIAIANGELVKVDLHRVQLNRGDQFRLAMDRQEGGYRIDITGKRIDVRSLVKQVLSGSEGKGGGGKSMPIRLNAKVEQMLGFGNEELSDVTMSYMGHAGELSGLSLSARTKSGAGLMVQAEESEGGRSVQLQSADAGAMLRFLDLYPHMAGGSIDLRLAGPRNGPLRGQVDAREFHLVNEPRLKSLVSSAPAGGPSLSDAARGRIQVSRARFEHGFARIEKGDDFLAIVDGVLRGPEIGSTFQGTLYDANGKISMTGTFMPAYGLNRIFAEIPFFGLLLGNGRDRGLIGITYKLSGDAKAPQLTINPISAIAPGVFRNIFQFH